MPRPRWLSRLLGQAELERLIAENKDLRAALQLSRMETISVRRRFVEQTGYVHELEMWKARFERRRS